MPQFLTVKEAAKFTGKSASSIRRVIYPIIEDDQHADRQHIEPTIEDVKKLRMKGENFAWRISEELLRREVPVEVTKSNDDGRGDSPHRTTGDIELLSILRFRRPSNMPRKRGLFECGCPSGCFRDGRKRLRTGDILRIAKKLRAMNGTRFAPAPTII